jgi:hypothetical protein
LTRINTVGRAGAMMQPMFESPLEWCRVCRDWVALDQCWEEHARERGCGCPRHACPLAALFRPSAARQAAGGELTPSPEEQAG